MGIVLLNIKSKSDNHDKDTAYIECTDINTDISQYLEKYKQEGIKNNDIVVWIENNANPQESDLILSVDDFMQAKQKIEFLTSHIKEDDSQEEKFAKIVTSLHKHIKYAHAKVGNKKAEKTQDFINGIKNGKCTSIGMAQILREALLMNGIECEIADSVNNMTKEHMWNKVKIGDCWYNWDQTDIMHEIVSLNKIGRNLKTDKQMQEKQLYQNYDDDITCNSPPSDKFIKKINFYAKKNKNKVPGMDKSNFFAKILNKFKKEKIEALPQTTSSKESINDNANDITIIEQEKMDSVIAETFNLWKIKICNNDISKTIRTLYIGLDAQDDIEKLANDYQEEFKRVFYTLVQSTKSNYAYIGNITRGNKSENNGLIGTTPTSQKNIRYISTVNSIIKKDIEKENTKIINDAAKQKTKEIKSH